jgi:predicted ATP-dependent protease
VARLVELAAELSEDRERLTLQLAIIKDMVTEAHHFAQKEGHKAVMAQDVEAAINARRRRASMMEERLRESAVRGFINVETKGSAVGQINGLSVLSQGDYAFGQASRITGSIGLGKEGVVDIDRESDLSGPFHTKGVLILSGFLRDRFAKDGALTLTASLVFEQSYAMVDGDSASLAELLTLISGLSEVPLRQDLAVTGSVSQQGQVQAIGGVNQKIEGFFRLCQARGLSGSQGVVIPKANLKNLMLHPDIVAAAKKKKFTVYAVETVEEALELFSGQKAGQPTKAGYTRGSIYDRVTKELKRLRELSRRKAASPKKAAKPKPRTRGGRK